MIKVNDKNFQTEVLEAKKPVLVDFFGTWCAPCQLAEPVLEELAKEYKDKVKFAKSDIDESQALAEKYKVMSVPTVIIFKNGQEATRQMGFPGKNGYENLIKKSI